MEIQSLSIQISAFRIIECVLDWKPHIRSSKLRHNRTIFKLYHRMDNALWLDNNLNMIQIHIKQPSGFHNLQTFIDQGCRIYCDLLSHYPVRVLQGICKRHMFQFFSFSSTEGTTGSCDQKLLNLRPLFPMKSLENSTVLTVYRKDLNSMLFCHRNDQMTCCYQCFFVCKGNVLARLDSLHCRTDSNHSHNSGNQNICLRHTCKLQKSLHTRHNFYIHI